MKQIIVTGLTLVFTCSFITSKSQSLIYDVVPIESKIYKHPSKIFVYTAQGKLPATTALPVFYLTNIQEKDNLFYQNLNKMVEEGSMPPMLIVGIHKQTSMEGSIIPANPHDPKKIFIDFRSDDDNYFAYIENEVVPLIEEKYNCSKYKIFSSHETAFTNYILKNYPSAFNAYVIEKPLIWIDNTQLTKLKPGTSTLNIISADIYFPEEYYLKYGKKPAWHQE